MNRTILSTAQGGRSFDFVSFEHDAMLALAQLAADVIGSTSTALGGFAATPDGPADLSINLAAGSIYQLAEADATADGAIVIDTTQILQQGLAAAQKVTLTAPATGGQSQWNLIQAQFSQVDQVRANDPNGGVVPFFNSVNPNSPTFSSVNTERVGAVVIQVIKGAAATTGSEVPPTPTSGFVPLYLVDLANGQTQITTGEILTAGPSVGTNVPSNYPAAPFLKGLAQLANQTLTPVSVTGTNHTFATADAAELLERSNSGTVMEDTLPGTSLGVLPARWATVIKNTDSSALYRVTVASGANLDGVSSNSVILGPGQTCEIVSDGTNYFTVGKPVRAKLGANTSIFVATTGSDTANDGLTSSTPFATIQHALNTLVSGFDLANFDVTIQLANGTYTAGLNAIGPLVGAQGNASLIINGNSGSPSSVIVSVSGGNCFEIELGLQCTIENLEVTGGTGLNVETGASVVINNVVFGACTQQHVLATDFSFVGAGGNYSISGNAPIHANVQNNAVFSLGGVTVTLTGTPAFSSEFVQAVQCGSIASSGTTFSGSATGNRYSAQLNGTINTSGGGASYFPGSVAGSTTTGGQYA